VSDAASRFSRTRAAAGAVRTQLAAALAGTALVWVLAVLAGIYTVTLVPAAILLSISAALVTPRIARQTTRTLDLALLGCLAFVLLQVVPLPAPVRNFITPHAQAVDTALALTPGQGRMIPLSVDPHGTWTALVVLALAVGMFFVAR